MREGHKIFPLTLSPDPDIDHFVHFSYKKNGLKHHYMQGTDVFLIEPGQNFTKIKLRHKLYSVLTLCSY
jgi:hypothetical protein